MEEEVFEREHGESIYDNDNKMVFFLPKNFWFDFVWPIGVTRQVLSYKYTVPIFDVLYLSVLIFFTFRFYHLSQSSHTGGKWFLLYFILQTIVNSALPPLSLRLLRDIFTNEAMPVVFAIATKYDKYYHIRISWICYLNLFACLVGIFCSALIQYSPFYSREVLPFVIFFIVPTGFALSLLVALMESNRLLQNRFLESIQTTDTLQSILKHIPSDQFAIRHNCNLSSHLLSDLPLRTISSSSTSLPLSNAILLSSSPNSDDIKQHFIQLRSNFLFVYHVCQSTGKRYGFVILLYIISLVMYSIYLIWFLYLIDDITMTDIMPYLTMCFVGLVELMFTLTLVNENGQNIRRQIAKYVMSYTNGTSMTGIEDITLLLTCSETLYAEIPFRGGFSLKFRHTAVIVGPLFASLIPTIVRLATGTS